MKAILLAAGRGSRLGSLTNEIPKCLVDFKSKPLLEHNLENIRKYFNDSDIVIVGGYRNELLKSFHSYILINTAWETTNIIGSLKVCEKYLLEEDCLIIYSDIYFHNSAIELMIEAKPPSIMNLVNFLEIWRTRFTDPLIDLETFQFSKTTNKLIEIGKKPQSLDEVEGQFGGIFTLNPETWQTLANEIPNMELMDATTLIAAALKKNRDFNVVDYSNYWAEFDSPDDLKNQD